jgi:hypothetical protein
MERERLSRRLRLLSRADELPKLLEQQLSFNLTGHKTFGLQPLSDFFDRRTLPGFRQLECAL